MNELPDEPVDGYVPQEPASDPARTSEEMGAGDQPVTGEPAYEADMEDDLSRSQPAPEETAFHVEEDSREQVAEDVVNDEISDERIEEAGAEAAFEVQVEEAVADAEAEAESAARVELSGVEPEVEAEDEPVEADAAEPEPAAVAEEPAAPDEDEEPAAPDPFRGPGDWYVVHTYAGYENKVKTNLESRIHTMQMEDKIFHVHIPMEDVMEIKGGKRQVVQRKVFPGYLLVKMLYDNDSWYVVRNTPGVTGFVAAGTGSKPTPLSKREVEKILAVKKEDVKPAFRLGFEEGDVVRIIAGPFADFNGTISEINLDQSKLKVLVNIFDRETPVELSFDQVAKV